MNKLDTFYISGIKELIFRREEDFFINFDPDALEFIKINMSGAKILFLISKGYDFDEITDYFTDTYNINRNNVKKEIKDFINNYRCKHLMQDILNRLNFVSYGDVNSVCL